MRTSKEEIEEAYWAARRELPHAEGRGFLKENPWGKRES
jgi:hypothetical protein